LPVIGCLPELTDLLVGSGSGAREGNTMNKYRVSIFLAAIIILSVCDAAITNYLVKNFPDGQEINPFTNTSSFSSILLFPVYFLVISAFIGCLVFAERNNAKLQYYIDSRSFKLIPFLFPTYFCISKLFAVVNNFFPLFNRTTPIYWIRRPFERWTNDLFIQTLLADTLIVMLLTPFLIVIAKRIYRTR